MTAHTAMPGNTPAPTERFAGYQVERTLGRGGLGSVVLARDARGIVTALKLVDLGGADGDTLAELFEREVAVARRLHHPRIVRVYDTGRVGDTAYIAMEYVAGGDLGDTQRQGRPTPMREALRLAADVAEALAHAHGQGVLHRDIKPANVLLEPGTGRAKLADFGLARLSDMQRSRTGVLAGTPAYMSPEQLAEGVQDARADLYSLGVLLFELITGRLPYEANSLGALLRQVSRTAAPPIGRFRADAPAALSALVERLLEKDRARRPSDAAGLASELETVLAALPDDSGLAGVPVASG